MRYLFVLTCLFAFGGCSHPQTTSNELGDPSALIGEEWSVDTIANLALVEESRATLLFGPDGNLTGNTSCNLVFASYEIDGKTLKITTAGGTRLMCADAVMDQEQDLRQILNQVTTYKVDASGRLTLIADEATITAHR